MEKEILKPKVVKVRCDGTLVYEIFFSEYNVAKANLVYNNNLDWFFLPYTCGMNISYV